MREGKFSHVCSFQILCGVSQRRAVMKDMGRRRKVVKKRGGERHVQCKISCLFLKSADLGV